LGIAKKRKKTKNQEMGLTSLAISIKTSLASQAKLDPRGKNDSYTSKKVFKRPKIKKKRKNHRQIEAA
jgi:hypothetical protein